MKLDGLVLESKYSQYQFLVKGPLEKVWRDGFPVDEYTIIPLQFDRYLCEVDEMARNQEWGEQQREAVGGSIQRHLDDPGFRDMWIHESPKPPLPWPTYDETHHNQIPVIAQATGMVIAALAYEQRGRPGGPRVSVVEKLSAMVGEQPVAAVEEGAAGEPDAQTDDLFAEV
jgi:hypothetical protein